MLYRSKKLYRLLKAKRKILTSPEKAKEMAATVHDNMLTVGVCLLYCAGVTLS